VTDRVIAVAEEIARIEEVVGPAAADHRGRLHHPPLPIVLDARRVVVRDQQLARTHRRKPVGAQALDPDRRSTPAAIRVLLILEVQAVAVAEDAGVDHAVGKFLAYQRRIETDERPLRPLAHCHAEAMALPHHRRFGRPFGPRQLLVACVEVENVALLRLQHFGRPHLRVIAIDPGRQVRRWQRLRGRAPFGKVARGDALHVHLPAADLIAGCIGMIGAADLQQERVRKIGVEDQVRLRLAQPCHRYTAARCAGANRAGLSGHRGGRLQRCGQSRQRGG
jgi:hypothetical protein